MGVLKTLQGDLLFFVNGVSQGVAATNIPDHVFAVIDMYGKCAQVTLTDKRGGCQPGKPCLQGSGGGGQARQMPLGVVQSQLWGQLLV